MTEPVLTYAVRDQIAHITLNRPERRNAIDDELSRALLDVWPRFEADTDARAGIAIPPIDCIPVMPFKVSPKFMMLAYKAGRFMDADRAYQLGLVNEVVSEGELMEAAERWAGMLETIPLRHIRSVKYGHHKAARMECLEREMDYVHYIWPQQTSGEQREAARSMREKREPGYGSFGDGETPR